MILWPVVEQVTRSTDCCFSDLPLITHWSVVSGERPSKRWRWHQAPSAQGSWPYDLPCGHMTVSGRRQTDRRGHWTGHWTGWLGRWPMTVWTGSTVCSRPATIDGIAAGLDANWTAPTDRRTRVWTTNGKRTGSERQTDQGWTADRSGLHGWQTGRPANMTGNPSVKGWVFSAADRRQTSSSLGQQTDSRQTGSERRPDALQNTPSKERLHVFVTRCRVSQ